MVQRLERAQATLPGDLQLLIIEGFRPLALQRHYFDEYLDELRALHPSGAAVDLTLCDGDGKELDLGTRVNASPEESEGRCDTDADGLSPKAQADRDILTSALTGA